MSESNSNVDRTKLILNTIKTYLIVVVGFGISGVAIVAVIMPLFSAVSVVSDNIQKEEIEVEKVRAQAQYLQTLSGLKDQLEGNVETAREAIPLAEDSVPYVLDQIVYMARQSGLEVESLALGQIANAADASKPNVVRIQLNVTGGYSQMLDLMQKIENSRRIIDMSNVSVSVDTNKTGEITSGDHNVSITLVTYFMPDVDTSTLTPDLLGQTQHVDKVLVKLSSMDYYSPDQLQGVPEVEIIPLEEIAPEPQPIEENTGIVPLEPTPTPTPTPEQ